MRQLLPIVGPTPRRAALARAAFALAVLLAPLGACGTDGGGPTFPDVTATDSKAPGDDVGPGDTTAGTNRAPELRRIGDRVAVVGVPLVIVVEAHDPDGDELTYSVFGTLPDGARFDKAARRFEWTPNTAGVTVFLTFVVSDGAEFDRETVRIEVVDSASAHPPVFVRVGDQQLRAGEPFALQLEATDPDGDTLTFGHDGALPSGASLDRDTGLFRWHPDASAAGTSARVGFTVTDGALSDTMSVRFTVSDGSGAQPPVFAPIPNQSATVGQQLAFTVSATDADGDPVSVSVDSGAPPGAQLSGSTFTWTPGAADAGKTWTVLFAATDGLFTVLTSVKISVSAANAGPCVDDPDEPNETIAQATPITPGTLHRTICETADAFDIDFYVITVPAQRLLTLELRFDAGQADLDLYLLDGAGTILARSELVTSPERISHVEVAGRDLYIAVVGFGPDPIRIGYELEVAVGPLPTDVCVDDAFEPNDTPATARPLPALGTPLVLCAGDRDFWTFPVACGQRVEVGMAIEAEPGADADLDMRLFDNPTATGAPVGIAETLDTFEVIEIAVARRPGTWLLEVYGYTADDEAPYELLVDTTGGCQDDPGANASAATATALGSASGSRSGLRMCCTDDWYRLDLTAGATVNVTASVTGQAGAIGLTAFAPNGTTQLASKVPSASGATLSFTAAATGGHYLVATGAVDTTYGLSWTIAAGGTCTSLSCATYTVCDAATGQCVSDWCDVTSDCPAGHSCVETYCANTCTQNGDCRVGYACKTFTDGARCGIAGSGAAGASCLDHTQCAGALTCSTEKKCQ